MSSSRGTAEHAASAESARANIPMLQAQAAILTPGMKHARSLLDSAIRVLEYFETSAAKDAAAGKMAAHSAADPLLVEEAERMVAMLTAFRRLA